MTDEYFCPNCNAILNRQPGFDPDNSPWTCTECGQTLFGDDMYTGDEYPGTVWYCDNCKACLNKQKGFRDYFNTWICSECYHENRISEDEIYSSKSDYERAQEEKTAYNSDSYWNDTWYDRQMTADSKETDSRKSDNSDDNSDDDSDDDYWTDFWSESYSPDADNDDNAADYGTRVYDTVHSNVNTNTCNSTSYTASGTNIRYGHGRYNHPLRSFHFPGLYLGYIDWGSIICVVLSLIMGISGIAMFIRPFRYGLNGTFFEKIGQVLFFIPSGIIVFARAIKAFKNRIYTSSVLTMIISLFFLILGMALVLINLPLWTKLSFVLRMLLSFISILLCCIINNSRWSL